MTDLELATRALSRPMTATRAQKLGDRLLNADHAQRVVEIISQRTDPASHEALSNLMSRVKVNRLGRKR